MYIANHTKNGVSFHLDGNISDVIQCVFIENFFSTESNQGVPTRIVPDNTVELILTNKKFERRISGQDYPIQLKSHFSGLKSKWQDIVLEGSPIISIRFNPEKVYHITGVPALELSNQALAPETIFGKGFEDFQDKLFNLKTEQHKLSHIESYFTSRLKEHNKPQDQLVQTARKNIENSCGNIGLVNLSKNLGVSQKTLETRFKLIMGLTPKVYCRLIRFINTVKNFHSSETNLTHLAYSGSFSDQSHLIKEFQHFTGHSPKRFFSLPDGIQEEIFSPSNFYN